MACFLIKKTNNKLTSGFFCLKFCFTFVGGNHETGVVVFVGYVYVGGVISKVFDNVKVAVKTGRT